MRGAAATRKTPRLDEGQMKATRCNDSRHTHAFRTNSEMFDGGRDELMTLECFVNREYEIRAHSGLRYIG